MTITTKNIRKSCKAKGPRDLHPVCRKCLISSASVTYFTKTETEIIESPGTTWRINIKVHIAPRPLTLSPMPQNVVPEYKWCW